MEQYVLSAFFCKILIYQAVRMRGCKIRTSARFAPRRRFVFCHSVGISIVWLNTTDNRDSY